MKLFDKLFLLLLTISLSQCTSDITKDDLEELPEPFDYVVESKNPGFVSGDTRVLVHKAEASEAQSDGKVEKSHDDNLNTHYHSRWGDGTVFPVTLTYYFENVPQIDYVVYHPRLAPSNNGNFKEFELWYSTEGNPDFVKYGEYDFEGRGTATTITFTNSLKAPKAIRFIVKSGLNNFVSCAEMYFYIKKPQPIVPPIFTDNTFTELLPGVGKKAIDTIQNDFFRNLAMALLANCYPHEFRIQEYKPYPHPTKKASENKTWPYSILDNPTGIYVNTTDELLVFVGKLNSGSASLSINVIDFDDSYSNNPISIKEGINVVKPGKKGLVYVMYHTSNPADQPVKIHIATGTVNGYYDIAKHDKNDWERLLNSAKGKYFDVLGQYSHMTFPTASFRQYTPNGQRLVEVYDSIAYLEQRFIGLEKYNRMNNNRMYFHVIYDGRIYATHYRTAYDISIMPAICDVNRARSTDIWGLAHEVGHINQTQPGFDWAGMTEVSNNVYSMYVQYIFGNKSRLLNDKPSPYTSLYEKGFTEIIDAGAIHFTYPDVFCKLIPFWQLELYYSRAKGYTDVYADIHEQVRLRPNQSNNGAHQMEFIRICCDVVKEDLTDFFKAWGMLTPVAESNFTCTQTQIDEIINYAKRYPKPAKDFRYIHDDNIEEYKH